MAEMRRYQETESKDKERCAQAQLEMSQKKIEIDSLAEQSTHVVFEIEKLRLLLGKGRCSKEEHLKCHIAKEIKQKKSLIEVSSLYLCAALMFLYWSRSYYRLDGELRRMERRQKRQRNTFASYKWRFRSVCKSKMN